MPIRRSRASATALLRLPATMFFACLLANAVHAQTTLPERGLSQAAVEQRFGKPSQVRTPVGQPPITRWVYPDFTVYFEGQYALHAVSHHAPPPAATRAPVAAPAAETTAPATGTQSRPAFRFDPASGQIIELDSAGNDVAAESVQADATPAEPVPERSAPAVEPAATAQPDATDAAQPADSEPRFRFDPVSGRIIMDDETAAPAAAAEEPAIEQAPEPSEPPAATPEAEPATGGGFRMQW